MSGGDRTRAAARGRRDFLKKAGILGVAGAAGLAASSGESGMAQAGVALVPTTAEFVVVRDGELLSAINGRTGQVDFEDTDATYVIQSAIDAIPSEPVAGITDGETTGTVHLGPGEYDVSELRIERSGIGLVGAGNRNTYLRQAARGRDVIQLDLKQGTILRGLVLRDFTILGPSNNSKDLQGDPDGPGEASAITNVVHGGYLDWSHGDPPNSNLFKDSLIERVRVTLWRNTNPNKARPVMHFRNADTNLIIRDCTIRSSAHGGEGLLLDSVGTSGPVRVEGNQFLSGRFPLRLLGLAGAATFQDAQIIRNVVNRRGPYPGVFTANILLSNRGADLFNSVLIARNIAELGDEHDDEDNGEGGGSDAFCAVGVDTRRWGSATTDGTFISGVILRENIAEGGSTTDGGALFWFGSCRNSVATQNLISNNTEGTRCIFRVSGVARNIRIGPHDAGPSDIQGQFIHYADDVSEQRVMIADTIRGLNRTLHVTAATQPGRVLPEHVYVEIDATDGDVMVRLPAIRAPPNYDVIHPYRKVLVTRVDRSGAKATVAGNTWRDTIAGESRVDLAPGETHTFFNPEWSTAGKSDWKVL